MPELAPADATRWPELEPLLDTVQQRFGERVDAIFLYGSYRRGRRDTIPDFYVLLSAYPPGLKYLPGRVLPPTVVVMRSGEASAKVTILTTRQLERAVCGDFHPYFWARFAQPAPVLYARDASIRGRCAAIREQAARRLVMAVARCWPSDRTPPSPAFWVQAFKLTYGAEMRSESEARIASVYHTDSHYYDSLLQRYFADAGLRRHSARVEALVWRGRQLAGKTLSIARLLKSVLTFEDPIDYLAWKVGRQSGVRIEPSERARRWPLIFGWGYVWRLYRAGGFR
ncbi:MAG: hypothetical protein H6993_01290 [Pseudomonadales bacterium]|nr:hypothetical protein [Pseudomonadales bacterium]MCP5182559.1 hypothetical protein [Pseudomonadales bacterium]